MDEQQKCTLLYCCHGKLPAGHNNVPITKPAPPQHSDEWLEEALDWSGKALMASILPKIIEGKKTIPIDQEFLDKFKLEAKQVILTELKKREVAARVDELRQIIDSYSHLEWIQLRRQRTVDGGMGVASYVDNRLAQLHKEQPEGSK